MGRARLAALHGVATFYEPAPGHRIDVPDDTVVAVLAALGVDASTPRAVRAALDEHAHWEANRLLPQTVVLRRPTAPAPTAPHPGAPHPGAPTARISTPQPPGRARRPRHSQRARPVPALPEGTLLHVDTESGESLPWDGSAFFRGNRALRACGSAALASASAATGTTASAGQLPLGTHTLRALAPDGRSARATLIVAPERMPAPPGRSYGFLVQLYSLLSARSWGMGDLGDLAELAAWSGRSLGAGFLQLNPLHVAVPGGGENATDPSPYRPSSRRFPDPVHLRVEEVPEYGYLDGAARRRADELRARAGELRDGVLRKDALIDRDAVWRLKREALELVHAVPMSPGRRAAYCDFLAEQGRALEDHATWCALAGIHGPDWHAWPGGLRDPRSARTARARGELLDSVDFHCWLAWLTDGQLAAAQRAARDAGMAIGLVHDLAVGVHPGGSDAWAQQGSFAAGMSVGAPPDAFNSRGQDWGLPPWRPDALAAAGYAPPRELLRGVLRHAGALRIDHVMGLFRLWWVPEGREPTEGTYVRYDAEAMLGVLALEANRAGAVVIGEDLGTVERGVRETLAGRGVLGTSVLWFERDYDAQEADAREADAQEADAREADTQEAEGLDAEGASGEAPEAAVASRTAAPGEHRESVGGAAATGAPAAGSAGAAEAAEAAEGPPGGADRGEAERARRARPLEPAAWRSGCLATATTHDLPSTAARLTGEHVELRERLGLLTRPLAQEQSEDSVEVAEWLGLLGRLGLLPEGAEDEEGAIKAVYRFLAATPAQMVGVWLPDAVGDRRPQNLPGTWDQYPNWKLPIADADGRPVTLEQLAASPRLRELMAELAERVPRAGGDDPTARGGRR
ncbi:4-alpha-glucanotransferase [Streptomyces sp. NPDC051776]|uniref:4-alpha-glucanotransferase n=1 Tax=Streptomyces sp. NPDC051776 TaxID=3155414 RepID=UPI0034460D32